MCRWAAYIGAPIFLSEVITAPGHSLIAQSRHAEECKTTTNADGFGVAWYDKKPEPGLYRDVYPAWSDPNLRSVAEQVQSHLFLAHVRASTGSATSRNNCHPFAYGKWSFMHNGQIGGYEQFRKQTDMLIDDGLYHARKGATDSEALFLIAVGAGLDGDPSGALRSAVLQMQSLAEKAKAEPAVRLAAAFSDGTSLYAVRYASDAHAPSLYYRRSDTRGGWAVVSEPLEPHEDWVEVPSGSFCRFTKTSVEVGSFI